MKNVGKIKELSETKSDLILIIFFTFLAELFLVHSEYYVKNIYRIQILKKGLLDFSQAYSYWHLDSFLLQ